MQWKALTAFGDTTLASTISYCLNFKQGLKRDEYPRPKLVSPIDIKGKTKSVIEFTEIDVSFNYENKNEYSFISRT